MHVALRAEGHQSCRGRVERSMRRHRIRALAGRRLRPRTTDSRHYLPIAPNLLAQRLAATAHNRIRLADITYIATGEGWLYRAAVLGLATRKIETAQSSGDARSIVAMAAEGMRDNMRTEQSLAAPTIGAVSSMSRTGNCHDNAPTESFFHTLKVDLVHQGR